ncbi:MAG: helicase-related protein [Dehalobacterium sp.]|jgi:CRISPR-associated endonuclease/helicase Cas3
MSATLPTFVTNHIPLLKDYKAYFSTLSRYRLVLYLEEMISLDEFCDSIQGRLGGWLEQRRRVLITLNTRGSARKVWQLLEQEWPEDKRDIPLYFISSDVTPKDRMEIVDEIKEGTPCIVVSTQSIEAGVDIDMDLVLRDFAPLDSLIQIAGRCNREGKGPRGTVEIYDITNENGHRYSAMIYDAIHLQVTRSLLQEGSDVPEEEVLSLSESYFDELSRKKDTGQEHLERFIRWLDDTPVKEWLRGKERLQYTFIVSEQDPELLDALAAAATVKDRWERREAWRSLASRVANVSIQVDAKPGFNPLQIANELPGELWVLRQGYYNKAGGLNIEGETMIF